MRTAVAGPGGTEVWSEAKQEEYWIIVNRISKFSNQYPFYSIQCEFCV